MGKKKETTWAGVVARLLSESDMTPYRLAKTGGLTIVGVLGVKDGRRIPSVDTVERMLKAAGLKWEWLDRVKDESLPPPKLPRAKKK